MVDMGGAMGSSVDGEYRTPQWLLRFLEDKYGVFETDPCARAKSKVAPLWYGYRSPHGKDGLTVPWPGNVFMNPPYGRGIGQWVAKARDEALYGAAYRVVCLLPARTDTQWWIPCYDAVRWIFLTGRVQFERLDSRKLTSPAFPSVIVIFESRGGRKLRVEQAVVKDIKRESDRLIDLLR